MRILITLIVIAALAAGGYYYWQKNQAPKPDAVALETTPTQVVKGSIMQSVAATGRVVSNLDVDIKCKASGAVITLPFDISDSVKKGALLVELDPIDEVRAVKQAEVALAQSQAKLAQARQNVIISGKNLETSKARVKTNLMAAESRAKDARTKANRRRELLEQTFGSQEDYDSALTQAVQAETDLQAVKIQQDELVAQELALEIKRQDVELAKGEVAADEIAYSNAKQRLDDTKVIAPMDGVVSTRNVQIGTIISSGITNIGGGTAVLTLSDLSHIFVLASVDESDIGKVALNQPVNITADSHAGVRFKGKVVRIATKGVNLTNVVTFEVKIEIVSQNKSLLKPEMTTNVQIVAAQKDDVLVVPTQAVTRKGDNLVATLKTPTGTEERPVKVGMTDGNNFEVVSGLTEGETVMVHSGEADSRWRGDRPRPPVGGMMLGGPRRGR
jgi:HlyD family secretion protein